MEVKYTVLLEKNELGGYTATVPSLPGCITQGDTLKEALDNVREAISGYMEALKDINKPIPVELPLEVDVTA